MFISARNTVQQAKARSSTHYADWKAKDQIAKLARAIHDGTRGPESLTPEERNDVQVYFLEQWLKKVGVVAALLVLSVLPLRAQPPQPYIIDHTWPIEQVFEQIPPEIMAIVQSTPINFANRSVGAQMWDTFRYCWFYGPVNSPNWCKTKLPPLPAEQWSARTFNVMFNGWPNIGLPNEMTNVTGNTGLWTGMWPVYKSFITPLMGNYQIVALFPDYTMGSYEQPMANFFTDLGPSPQFPNGDNDALDMLAWADGIAPKHMIWMTSSVNKVDEAPGQLQRLAQYAAAARTFAMAHNLILVDNHDILTHCWNGTLATNTMGVPIQCADWGSQPQGGHFTNDNGHARIRLSKYWIVAFAIAMGWNPNGPTAQPPSLSAVCHVYTNTNGSQAFSCEGAFERVSSGVVTIDAADAEGRGATLTVPLTVGP